MLGALLKEASGFLDRRFFLNALLPSLTFCGLLVVVVVSTKQDPSAAIKVWDAQSGSMKGLQVAGFAAVVSVVASMLSARRGGVLRLFEGYWPLAARPLSWIGWRWHRLRLGRLAAKADDDSVYQRISLGYPPPSQPEQVMPTTLGNVLKAAELYPRSRYGIDAVLVWPRLFQVLPERHLSTVATARSEMELALAMSVLSGVFGFASGVYLLIMSGSWWLYLVCLWGASALAVGGYRSAVVSAAGYGQHIRVAFDLYRDMLRQELGEERPDPAEEREYWQRLCRFWYRGVPRDSAVEHVPRPADELVDLPWWHCLGLPLSGWFGVFVLICGVVGANCLT